MTPDRVTPMKQSLTYAELLENLKAMPPERLADTATVYVSGVDEYYPVMTTEVASDKQDVLDAGHWVVVV